MSLYSENLFSWVIIIIFLLDSFSYQLTLMVFHRSLSDSKSPQVSRTLPSILADLTHSVVWTVSNRPVISNSSSLFNNPLVTVPRAQIIINLIVTFMFYSFFNSIARSKYFSFFSDSFNFTLWDVLPYALSLVFFSVPLHEWS